MQLNYQYQYHQVTLDSEDTRRLWQPCNVAYQSGSSKINSIQPIVIVLLLEEGLALEIRAIQILL